MAKTDVLVHNFRPSVPARLGIAYEQFQDSYPRLIYCVVNGYGETGPMKDNAGYDQVLQSMTGICQMQGKLGQVPEIVYGSVVDYYAASMVASGVAAALYERERSGRGQYVGVSLLRSALAMQSARFIWAEGEGRHVGRDMRSGGVTACTRRAKAISTCRPTRRIFGKLCATRWVCRNWPPTRVMTPCASALTLRTRYCPSCTKRCNSTPRWSGRVLFGQEVPSSAARAIGDMFDHPQVLAEGMVTTLEHPAVGRYQGFTGPVKFGSTPGPAAFAAPMMGQHSGELLLEHGYSAQDVERLRAQGVVA